MYKLLYVYFLTPRLSLIIGNANTRAVKTYEVEVSVREAHLITLHATQRGSRRLAVLSPNLGVRWGMDGHHVLNGILRTENPLPPPGFKTLDIKLYRLWSGSKISVTKYRIVYFMWKYILNY
jgi:hypothetical protein